MKKTDYVAYLRVSTQRQGVSGLGLQAQQEIIRNYLSGEEPIAEFVEVESGRKEGEGHIDSRQDGPTIKKCDLYEPTFGFGHRNRIL